MNMKKILFTLALTLVAFTANAKTYNYDVNNDGLVSISDVTFLVNNILGVPNVDEDEQTYIYDVNGDGFTNVTDVTCLVNKILGIFNPGEDTTPYLTCPNENHPHLIDLGLPSGIKWSCCNVGAATPEAYGGYYAWGETEVKNTYDWSNYAYCDGASSNCHDLGCDIAGTEYDVAHVKWGQLWCMPSNEYIEELIDNCTFEYKELTDAKGCLVTGPSGGSIFLPAAGNRWEENLNYADNLGWYSSSTQDPSSLSHNHCIIFLLSGTSLAAPPTLNTFTRGYGLSVRPVYGYPILKLPTTSLSLVAGSQETMKITTGSGSYQVTSSNDKVVAEIVENTSVKVTAIKEGQAILTVTDMNSGLSATMEVIVDAYLELSTDILELAAGSQQTVEITSGCGYYEVETSEETVATAVIENNNVTVTANGMGKAVITVKDTKTNVTSTIEVTVICWQSSLLTCPDEQHPHYIDLGLPSGTRWACCNVGAGKPEAYGEYYAWGETEANGIYSEDTYQHYNNGYVNIGDDIAGTEYDVARVKWGEPWEMPSKDKIKELLDNCTSQWITMNNIQGARIIGTNGGSIFLPAAGFHENNEIRGINDGGYYWSSTNYPSTQGHANILASITENSIMHTPCFRGLSVRPISKHSILNLSTTIICFAVGSEKTVEITSGNASFTVESSDESVATAVIENTLVKVTGTGLGNAIITVTDTKTGLTATIEVTIVPNLELSEYTLRLDMGSEGSVEMTGSGNYTITNSDDAVATVVRENAMLKVTAMEPGRTIITVKDNITEQVKTIRVNINGYLTCPDNNHPHLINLGLPSGTQWSCCNVGYHAWDNGIYGNYYAWGEVTPRNDIYNASNYEYGDGIRDYVNIGNDIAGKEYDVAHVTWGRFWEMPSRAQFEELINNCSCTWVNTFSFDIFYSLNGLKVTSTNGGSIFFPAGGLKFGSASVEWEIEQGHYWSSTLDDQLIPFLPKYSSAYGFSFGAKMNTECNSSQRYAGCNVRPVCGN